MELQNKRYGVLSKGNRQKARIVFAEVLARVRNVELLALDEPFAGLDNRKLDGANPAPQMVSSAPVPRRGGINKPPPFGTYLVPAKPTKASIA